MELPASAIKKIFGGGSSSSDQPKEPESSSNMDSAPIKSTTDTSTAPVSETTSGPVKTDATVDSQTNDAVEHEQVSKTHHDTVQDVVTKEKHQDHYHTTVQPLKKTEVMPTEVDDKQAPTQERTFTNEDAAKTKAKLANEQSHFKDTTTDAGTMYSKTQQPTTVAGEEVHHHYHETVQPVIEKETVKPSVTHTKVPIHETHQEASVVHGTSVAQPMSVEAFEKAGNDVGSSNSVPKGDV